MATAAQRGRDLVRSTFGGALYQQGRGFYSALELLAILRGEVLLEMSEESLGKVPERVLPTGLETRYLRPSHDHARRLLVSGTDVVDGVFGDDAAREAVRSLLRGIEAPVPGRRSEPEKMQLRHFYPYPAEAIHYDAVERNGKVNVERYQFRGAGGLAHKALRTDPNHGRLAETRTQLRNLLSNGHSAVGQLLEALRVHDAVPGIGHQAPATLEGLEARVFVDDVEAKSLVTSDGGSEFEATEWLDLLREGVHRIVCREELSGFDRIDGLVHWVPWCIAMHQLAMARRMLGEDERTPIVFDAGRGSSPVRSLARKHLGEATASIKASLYRAARNANAQQLLAGSPSWWNGPRSFFTTTLYAVGALNANSGKRHFELRPQLLQAVVHALVDEPISISKFAGDVLGDRLCIVCDLQSASRFGASELDGRHLQTNLDHLSARLDEVGLTRGYSDSTLMVGIYE